MNFLKSIRKRVRRQLESRPIAMTERRRPRVAMMVEEWTPPSVGKLVAKIGRPKKRWASHKF
jgi:hypothetical protein